MLSSLSNWCSELVAIVLQAARNANPEPSPTIPSPSNSAASEELQPQASIFTASDDLESAASVASEGTPSSAASVEASPTQPGTAEALTDSNIGSQVATKNEQSPLQTVPGQLSSTHCDLLLERNYFCGGCRYSLSDQRELDLHSSRSNCPRVKGSSLCQYCRATFEDRRALREHVSKSPAHRGPDVFCSPCQRPFQTPGGFQSHVDSIHSSKYALSPEGSIGVAPAPDLQISSCACKEKNGERIEGSENLPLETAQQEELARKDEGFVYCTLCRNLFTISNIDAFRRSHFRDSHVEAQIGEENENWDKEPLESKRLETVYCGICWKNFGTANVKSFCKTHFHGYHPGDDWVFSTMLPSSDKNIEGSELSTAEHPKSAEVAETNKHASNPASFQGRLGEITSGPDPSVESCGTLRTNHILSSSSSDFKSSKNRTSGVETSHASIKEEDAIPEGAFERVRDVPEKNLLDETSAEPECEERRNSKDTEIGSAQEDLESLELKESKDQYPSLISSADHRTLSEASSLEPSMMKRLPRFYPQALHGSSIQSASNKDARVASKNDSLEASITGASMHQRSDVAYCTICRATFVAPNPDLFMKGHFIGVHRLELEQQRVAVPPNGPASPMAANFPSEVSASGKDTGAIYCRTCSRYFPGIDLANTFHQDFDLPNHHLVNAPTVPIGLTVMGPQSPGPLDNSSLIIFADTTKEPEAVTSEPALFVQPVAVVETKESIPVLSSSTAKGTSLSSQPNAMAKSIKFNAGIPAFIPAAHRPASSASPDDPQNIPEELSNRMKVLSQAVEPNDIENQLQEQEIGSFRSTSLNFDAGTQNERATGSTVRHDHELDLARVEEPGEQNDTGELSPRHAGEDTAHDEDSFSSKVIPRLPSWLWEIVEVPADAEEILAASRS